MNGGSGKHEELFALRRALWEVAERAQRAIAQLDTYVKTHRDTASRSGAAEELPAEDDGAPQQAPSPLLHDVLTTGAGVRARTAQSPSTRSSEKRNGGRIAVEVRNAIRPRPSVQIGS